MTITLTDAILIVGIIATAGAIVCFTVVAIVSHFPPDTDDERADEMRDTQRRSHPEIW